MSPRRPRPGPRPLVMPQGRSIPRTPSPGVRRPRAKPGEDSAPPAALGVELAKAGGELQALASRVRGCADCRRAGGYAFGSGYPRAPLFLLKERPSADDIRTETAFSSEAEALERAFERLRIPFSWVYGTTAVKQGEAETTSDDLRACAGHLLVELEAVGPKVVVAFGDRALEAIRALDGRCGLRVPDDVPRGEAVPLRPTLVGIVTEPLPDGVTEPDAKRRLWKDLQILPSLVGA